ncbi:host attachment protein [Maritalea porphyrae]|uniref:Host attachment protein n=1 Tax=Maritalea porphyrae TaxID=880732 RepID=A0ABQ5UUN8_9HYPH|nr:host attachment protein [Maritalea porphyrae]GLQ18990.1 hypothetical protein GCM10007879_32390 [Maritalea porphyrae]
MKPQNRRILVASGTKARFFDHKGTGKALAEIESKVLEREHLRAQDIQSDAPGRTFASQGDGRSAMAPRTEPTEKAQADFAASICAQLQKDEKNDEYQRLVIVASPSLMGDLRKAMPDAVAKKVEHEISKDLTHIPPSEIGKHLDEVIFV